MQNTEELAQQLESLIKNLKIDLDASLIEEAKNMLWRQVAWSFVNLVEQKEAAKVFEEVENRIQEVTKENPDDVNGVIQDALCDFRLEAREILGPSK